MRNVLCLLALCAAVSVLGASLHVTPVLASAIDWDSIRNAEPGTGAAFVQAYETWAIGKLGEAIQSPAATRDQTLSHFVEQLNSRGDELIAKAAYPKRARAVVNAIKENVLLRMRDAMMEQQEEEVKAQEQRLHRAQRMTQGISVLAVVVVVAAAAYLLMRGKSRGDKRRAGPAAEREEESVNLDFDNSYKFMFDKQGKLKRRRRRINVENAEPAAAEAKQKGMENQKKFRSGELAEKQKVH